MWGFGLQEEIIISELIEIKLYLALIFVLYFTVIAFFFWDCVLVFELWLFHINLVADVSFTL